MILNITWFNMHTIWRFVNWTVISKLTSKTFCYEFIIHVGMKIKYSLILFTTIIQTVNAKFKLVVHIMKHYGIEQRTFWENYFLLVVRCYSENENILIFRMFLNNNTHVIYSYIYLYSLLKKLFVKKIWSLQKF